MIWSGISFLMFWICFSMMQEHVFKTLGVDLPLVVALVHHIVTTFLAFCLHRWNKDSEKRRIVGVDLGIPPRRAEETIPYIDYIVLGACLVALRMGINIGLKNVDYNTKTIFQSARAVPVLLGGLWFGQSVSWRGAVSCAVLTLGVLCVAQADAVNSPDFRPIGVALLSLAACADAVRLNLSERLLRSSAPRSINELMVYSEAFGGLMVFFGSAVTGELVQGVTLFLHDPWVLGMIVLMGLLAFGGGLAMMVFVQEAGAYNLSLLGIARMLLSIGGSIVVYKKGFGRMSMLGVLLVAFSMWLHTQDRKEKKRKH